MSSRRLLIENIVSLTVLQGLNYAAPLITLPYLVHVLQPSQFGLLSFAQTMLVFEMDVLLSKIMLFSAVLALPLTVILSNSFGAIGAITASVTTAAFLLSAMLFSLQAKGIHIWQRPKPDPPFSATPSAWEWTKE